MTAPRDDDRSEGAPGAAPTPAAPAPPPPLARNALHHGDALQLLARVPDGSVDLVVADPPYNLGKAFGNDSDRRRRGDYEAFTRAWLAHAARALAPTGSIYVFMGVRFVARLYAIMEDELALRFNGWITWHYTQGMGRTRGFSPRHEDILYFTKSDAWTFDLDAVRVPQKYYRRRNNMAGANPGDVWQVSHVHYCAEEREPHPTQKPEALVERMVRASSRPGDLVLDPFAGSGTTCRVAAALGREWIGIELNGEYAARAAERIARPFAGFDSADPRVGRTPKG